MHARFDQLVKQLLTEALGPTGRVETEAEVTAAPQRADLVYEPDPRLAAARASLGLLGRMSIEPCLFEAFQRTPVPADILPCLRKQLTLLASRAARARRRSRKTPAGAHPVLWVVSSGRPKRALAGFGMQPMDDWPPGFYTAPASLRMHVVVARELPRTRETLMLRLMGRGRVLIEAVEDLQRLPPDAWERKLAVPILVQLRLTIPADRTLQSPEERAVVMSTLELYEAFKTSLIEKGIEEGIEKGIERLREAITRIYEARFGAPSPSLEAAIAETKDAETLAAWAPLFATAPREEVDAAVLAERH